MNRVLLLRAFSGVLVGALALGLGACAGREVVESAAAPEQPITWIASRNVEIPISLVLPSVATSDAKVPLVVLVHGHGGTRHEAGGYTRVAEGLAAKGIASVRMDFPGCGDSREPFSNNNLSNMLADIRAAQSAALASARIDTTRMGLLGFSMGGRLAITLAVETDAYKAMALWAPSASNGAASMVSYLGGAQTYAAMKAQAQAQGYAPFTTFWGQAQQLGYRWFTDLEASMPATAIASYTGALFVLYGDLDDVMLPAASRQAAAAARNASSTQVHEVVGADHGLGLFNDDFARSEEAVSSTVNFLVGHL